MKTIIKNLLIVITLIIALLGGMILIGYYVNLCMQYPILMILTCIYGIYKIFKEMGEL